MALKQVILHIGMDKTGSSSIRASLARRLDDPAFHYAYLGSENAARTLAAAFMDDPTRSIFFRQVGLRADEVPAVRAKALQDLAGEIAKAEGRTLILSSEGVSRFNADECGRLAEYLCRHTGDLRVAGYVRKPKAYMESNFQQQVKSGVANRLNPATLLTDYQARFVPVEQGFGRERVTLWPFEPAMFPQSNVVLHFCEHFGIRFDPARLVRTNDALSRHAVSLLFAFRVLGRPMPPGPEATRANNLLFGELKLLRGPKLRLHSSIVAPAVQRRRASIEWMEARLGHSLSEDLEAEHAHGVRHGDELLQVAPEASKWLADRLGGDALAAWHPMVDARQVADWIRQLAERLLARAAAPKSAAA